LHDYHSWKADFLLFLIFVPGILTAQKEARFWYFGDSLALDFGNGTGTPTVVTNSAMLANRGSASISDKNGNLLFYTNGTTVWNKTHQVMQNGTGLYGSIYGYGMWTDDQSVIIVPHPGNYNLYYVFTKYPVNSNIYYSMIDISKNSGLGEVISKNNLLVLDCLYGITLIRHANNSAIWVVTQKRNSNAFYSFQVTNLGLSLTPVISYSGSTINTGTGGQIIASSQSDKIATNPTNIELELFDFDNTTGIISNKKILSNQFCVGVEFSPDGTKLYTSLYNSNDLIQFDVSSNNATIIINSLKIVGKININGVTGMLQHSIDGKIYHSHANNYLGCINNPNSSGLACNYTDSSINLNKFTGIGLPIFLYNYSFIPKISISNPCYKGQTNFTVSYIPLNDSLNWDFDDNLSGINNHSILLNPSHVFTDTGAYNIKLFFYHNGTPDTVNQKVYIKYPPNADFLINDSSQCLKSNNFTCSNNSSIKSGKFSQIWDFGDGYKTVTYNTVHSYGIIDSFWIKLLIVSDWGCKDSILKQVIVHPDQNTTFNISDTNVCIGELLSFSNTSSYNYGTLLFNWEFGDGNNTSSPNPQHFYTVDSTFEVKLISTNNFGCTDSIFHKVYVNPSSKSDFIISDTSQCLRSNLFVLTNKSTIKSGTFSQKWEFGDGNGTFSYSTSHSFTTVDSFIIKLVTISDSGCKDSISRKVIVHPDQSTNFNASDTSVCIGELIQFSNSSTYNYGTLTFKWDFGDGNSTITQNPQHSYAIDSSFKVKLVSTNNFGCKDSVFHKVYINPFPKTGFTINDTAQCLQGNNFTFTDISSIKSGSIIQNYFDFGDGTNSLLLPVTHTYLSVGAFLVKLVSKSDQGCSDSLNKTVYLRPMPIAGFTINSKTQNLVGNNFVFTSTSVIPTGNLKYYWDFGDGDTSTNSNPTHSYNAAGSYKVKIIATSDFGCADTFSDSVFVLSYPNMHVSFTVQNACVGEEVLFKNTSTVSPPDSFLNFLWDFGDGNTIVLKEPKHIYASAGKYTIRLAVLTAFGYKDSITDTIEIFADPAVNIAATPDTIVIPGSPVTLTASGLYDLLLWFDNSTSNSVSVTSEGTYWVIASYTNGCKSSDTIILTKGEIKEPELVNVITPNGDGVNDLLVVKNIDSIKPCKLAIYNRWGDELFSTSDYQNNWDGKYKGKSLPEGTYYYVLVAKDGKVFKGAVNILK